MPRLSLSNEEIDWPGFGMLNPLPGEFLFPQLLSFLQHTLAHRIRLG